MSTKFIEVTSKEEMLKAVSKDGMAIRFVSEELQYDRDIVVAAIENNGDALLLLKPEFRKDKEIVKLAVKTSGLALDFVLDESFKDDKEIVLEAVKQDGRALWCASKRLRSDKEVVITAIQQNPAVIKYISEDLRHSVIDYCDVISTLIHEDNSHDEKNLIDTFIPIKISNSKYAMSHFCAINGLALEYANMLLQDDEEIVMTAIKSNWKAIKFASKRLKNDKNIIIEAAKENVDALAYVGRELQCDTEQYLEILKSIIKPDSSRSEYERIIKYLPKEIKNNQRLVNRLFNYNYR